MVLSGFAPTAAAEEEPKPSLWQTHVVTETIAAGARDSAARAPSALPARARGEIRTPVRGKTTDIHQHGPTPGGRGAADDLSNEKTNLRPQHLRASRGCATEAQGAQVTQAPTPSLRDPGRPPPPAPQNLAPAANQPSPRGCGVSQPGRAGPARRGRRRGLCAPQNFFKASARRGRGGGAAGQDLHSRLALLPPIPRTHECRWRAGHAGSGGSRGRATRWQRACAPPCGL